MDTKKPKQNEIASNWLRLLFFGLVALVPIGLLGAFVVYPYCRGPGVEISATELFQSVAEGGRISELELTAESGKVSGVFTFGSQFHSQVANLSDLEKLAVAKGVKVTVGSPTIFRSGWFWFVVVIVVLSVSQILCFYWMTRRDRKAEIQRAKDKLAVEKPKERFHDIGGYQEVKEEVSEVVDFVKHPADYEKYGARVPSGILLIGPPGTGKTLFAKAIAGECGFNFLNTNGSEFVEVFVGKGARNVRDIYKLAEENAPCVVFIDQIEALAGQRGAALSGGEREHNQTVSEFLNQLQGFNEKTGVLTMGATDQPEVLDRAVVRPGRLDRKILMTLPDQQARLSILTIHARGKPLAKDVNLEEIAQATSMLSGADLAAIVNEAAIFAKRRQKPAISQKDIYDGIEKVLWGPERKGKVIQDERLISAYHEGGHTLVAKLLPDADPVRKVTILGRGASGGSTWMAPLEDRNIKTKKRLLAELRVAMGGRVGEMLKFSDESSGAYGDFLSASNTARDMVCRYGMSEKIGKLVVEEKGGFMGMVTSKADCSEEKKRLIDEEIKRLTDEAYADALRLVKENKDKLEALAQALLVHETLTGKEIDNVLTQVEQKRKQVTA